MKEAGHLCWFYSVWWEEQKRQVDCLVDLNISTVPELNDGFWLIRDEHGLVLMRAGKIMSGSILGQGVSWSIEV